MAELCWVNREGNISYRESTRQQSKKALDPTSQSESWSKFLAPKVETSNVYDVLSGGVSASSNANVIIKSRKSKEKIPVLDDWETFEG